MNENIRERILRKLDTLSDERGYQVLDYVEFLESRYAERQTATNAFTRFTEVIEDKLRAGKVSASAIAETVGLMNRAASVLSGAVAATQKMATEFVSTPSRQTQSPADTSASTGPGASSPGAPSSGTPAAGAPPASAAQSSAPLGDASSTQPSPPSATPSAAPAEAPDASGEKL